MFIMSEKIYTSEDVEAAARSVGYSPSKSTKQIRREQKELIEALKVGTFPSEIEPLDRMPTPRRSNRARRAVGAVAAAGALAAGGIGLLNKIDNGVPTSGEKATYVVQEGDTADQLARQIEAAHDGVAGNEDVRPMIDDIMKQSNNDGQPGLQVGEKIEVPASADIYADIEGVQLTHK